MFLKKGEFASLISVAIVMAMNVSVVNAADQTTVYLTRHAEKLTVQTEAGLDNCAPDKKGKMRCEEALSKLGEVRSELLAEWFSENGIASEITHVISSDKKRTRQTVEPTAELVRSMDRALLDNDDGIDDGVVQVPNSAANKEGNELTSNSKSVQPTVDAILALPAGSVAVVAAHSGTIYNILGGSDTDGNPATGKDEFSGLGIDTTVGGTAAGESIFPKKESNGKVPTFGDLWKIVIDSDSGEATVAWRKNLQMQSLELSNEVVSAQ